MQPSCSQLLKVDPPACFIKARSFVGVKVSLDSTHCKAPRKVCGPTCIYVRILLQFSDHSISVYCRQFNQLKAAELKQWGTGDAVKDTELAQKLTLSVSKGIVPPAVGVTLVNAINMRTLDGARTACER